MNRTCRRSFCIRTDLGGRGSSYLEESSESPVARQADGNLTALQRQPHFERNQRSDERSWNALDRKKCFVVDLDGTVYVGNQPIQPTVDYIVENLHSKEFYFLTNNTSLMPHEYVAKLHRMGIETDESHIVSPHSQLIEYLKGQALNGVFVVGNNSFQDYLKKDLPGLRINAESGPVEAVVVAYDNEVSYDKLSRACLLLQSDDVELIATNCDITCPSESGPLPDAGSILALIEAATLRESDVALGKPDLSLLDSIRRKFRDDEIVIVGDRLYTDKEVADEAGVDFILVLSGETDCCDDTLTDSAPWMVLENLGELRTPLSASAV